MGLYRYIDWTITVPLQMIEFYIILSAVSKDISKTSFWKLLIGTVIMLVAGYMGEAGSVASMLGETNQHVQRSFGTMRLIVTAGWSIYPAGYFFGYLMGGVDDASLNMLYNLADFVNKIGFCLAIWQCGKNDTAEKGEH